MKKICLISLVVLLFSCKKEPVMDRTIFIPDEDDATLPAYTEWGYNSFGAKYDRDYFLVSNAVQPCKITYSNNLLQFALFGIIESSGEKMSLTFTFPSPEMRDFKDLVYFDNVKIDMDSTCEVRMSRNGKDTVLNIVSGELYFQRAQLLSIDDKINRVILSGTFDLQFLQSRFPTYISDGRFDVGITQNYFYWQR